jgi:hypothetical protein
VTAAAEEAIQPVSLQYFAALVVLQRDVGVGAERAPLAQSKPTSVVEA